MKNLAGIILLITMFSCGQPASPLEKLRSDIISRLDSIDGEFAVAYKNLSNGDTLYLKKNEVFHAASTMKTPVMIEIFRQSEKGYFSLDDSLEVKNEFASIVDGSPFSMDLSEDSEPGLYEKIGTRLSIRKLIFPMITSSSNLAANILIEKVGAKNVTATMRELGAMNIQVLRGVEDLKAFDQGLNNTTTALDLAIIMESIAENKAAKEQSCKEMLDYLFQQKFNEIIPAKLPADVAVAHKTGSITGVQHDSGIVYLPNGTRYVLVLLSKELTDRDKGIIALSDISYMIYQFAAGESTAN